MTISALSVPRLIAMIVVSLSFLIARGAAAQGLPESRRAAVLFDEGNALAAKGAFDAACPKFAESQRLDPSLGTQYNLALCLEKRGQLGSAWRHFRAVERLARATGNEARESAARQKLAILHSRVHHLSLSASDSDAKLTVDGEQVDRDDWDFYPVDSGEHTVLATAPGKMTFETRVAVAPSGGGESSVVIPKLALPRGATRIVTRETSNTRRTLAFVAGGLGVAGVGAGVVTGLIILDEHAIAKERCTPTCSDQTGRDAVSAGKTLLPVNVVAWSVGVAGLAAGSFLLLTSSPKKAPATQIVPVLGGGAGGASVVGRF